MLRDQAKLTLQNLTGVCFALWFDNYSVGDNLNLFESGSLMKTETKSLFLRPVLIAAFGLMLAGRVTAQTFTTLHSFTALINSTNSDGRYPEAPLVLSGNILYGTATYGGSSGQGTVFAINTDGTGFNVLHSFPDFDSDGGGPYGGLILS